MNIQALVIDLVKFYIKNWEYFTKKKFKIKKVNKLIDHIL